MRSFKKIAAMIMAVAMLCSFTALGADISVSEITFSNNVANIKYTAEGVDEVTALVYSGALDSADVNIVYIDQFAASAKAEEGLSIDFNDEESGSYSLMMGGTGLSTAYTGSLNYTKETRTFSVSLAETSNGYIKCDNALTGKLDEDTEITLTFAPYIGYALDALTIGGNVISGLEATNGVYTYTHTVTADAEIAVTFAKIETDENGDVYTSGSVYDVDGDKVVFGKAVVGTSGNSIEKTGMKVEKYVDGNWVPFGTDGIFEATEGRDANNAYGIHFQGFAEGKYRVSAYVYFDGVADPVYGDAVEFTVG